MLKSGQLIAYQICQFSYSYDYNNDDDDDDDNNNNSNQHARKMVSDCLGLVDFAIGLVNFVLNLPDRQAMFLEEFE